MDVYTNSTLLVQKGRDLGSRDPISKFWDPLITFERKEYPLQILYRHKERSLPCVRTIKRPLSERGLGHVI